MKKREVIIVAGPCAVESEEQITSIGYKISQIRDIAQDYHINLKLRGGAWKPRTLYFERGHKVFDGTREEGVRWLAKVADKYNLSIVTEIMSNTTLNIFERYLNPNRDFLQIGARTSQAFALLEAVGKTRFGVFLKNPLHGVDITESIGAFQRFVQNNVKVFCIRGQKIVSPILEQNAYRQYLREIYTTPHQHPDARYLNNIEAIVQLRRHPFFIKNKVLFCYDPSHVWGGKTDLMKRRIGEYAIKAVQDFQYDGIIIEVNDKSVEAICDADQALLTTINNIQWSKTSYGREPHIQPITLVDIVSQIMKYQSIRINVNVEKLREDITSLATIEWTPT